MMRDAPAPAAHPVLAAQRRIAEAFRASEAEKRHDFSAALPPLLEALRWRGRPRQLFEALPHLTPLETALSFRAVLDRLGIKTRALATTPAALDGALLPALIIPAPDMLLVALRRDDEGKWLVFDTRQNAILALEPAGLAGDVFLVRLKSGEGEAADAPHNGVLRRAMGRLRPRIGSVVWHSIGISIIGLLAPLYMMMVYDKVVATRSLDTLAFFAIGIIGALVIEARLRHKRARHIAWIVARFDAFIAVSAFRAVLSLPLSMSETAPVSAQLSRFRHFAVGRELFRGPLASALVELPFTLFFLALVFILGGVLGWVLVALAAALLALGLVSTPGSDSLARHMNELRTRSDALMMEATSGIDAIRRDHAEPVWQQRLSSTYAACLAARFETQGLSRLVNAIAQALVSIAGVGILALGAAKVMDGAMSTGTLVGIMAVVWRVLGPIQTICLSLHRLRGIARTLKQIDQLLRMKPERAPGTVPIFERRFKGAFTLTNVALRYPSRPDFALRNVSLSIDPGQFVAIAGPSGAGKSTLLRVLQGLYQPQGGMIAFDHFDLRQLDSAELRQTITLLSQNAGLFYGTIAQNIRLSAPDVSDAEIEAMLARLGVTFPNPVLPDGIETRLSAATRAQISPALEQRIRIARAMIRPGAVLMLDQPEAHLDQEGVTALMRAIKALRGQITIILVTSSLQHLAEADKIVVMKEGMIEAEGRPGDILPALMAKADRAA